MFCSICGCPLKADDFFCPRCGAKIKEAVIAPNYIVPPEKAPLSNKMQESDPCTQTDDCSESKEKACTEAEAAEKSIPEDKEKEPVTFGLGVVVTCGAIILLLAVLCGVFGGLYFSERRNNRIDARASAIVLQDESFGGEKQQW